MTAPSDIASPRNFAAVSGSVLRLVVHLLSHPRTMNLLPDHEDIWIAAKLAALREMRGMTQAELAKRCGLKPAAIGLFEQGRRRPCLRNLLKLCEGLRCTPNDILLHNSQDQERQ